MPRQTSSTLTDAELRLMKVLWQRGRATVAEVAAALPGHPAPAYTTILTFLRILERKGFVRHDKQGRAFVYEPVIDRESASASAVRQILSRFFNNSPELLLLRLIEDNDLDARELARMKKRILRAREEEA